MQNQKTEQTLKDYSESLLATVNTQLEAQNQELKAPLQQAEQAIKILIPALEKLKTACLTYTFENKSEEISFFKESKPKLASKLIYFNAIFSLESNKPIGSKNTIKKYYKAELAKLKVFFDNNLEFYRYYRTGNSCLDKKYFLRGKHDIKLTLDSAYFQADQRFSTTHDYKVAQLIANNQLKVYLETELLKLENNPVPEKKNTIKTQKWTANKVALTELIYALHTEGVFNNGNSDLKEITTFFEKTFEVELGQFHRTFLEIRERKSDRTKFLNTLKEKLTHRMDTADEN